MKIFVIIDAIHRHTWLKGKRRDVLQYSTVNEDTGEVYVGGMISFDKKWLRPSIHKFGVDWIKLEYNAFKEHYYFPDPKDEKDEPFSVHDEVIEAIDIAIAQILEQDLLGYESETTIK